MNPTKQAGRRYFIELGLSMVAYVAVIWGRNLLLNGPMRQADKSWQIIVALLPMIPVVFAFAAIVRFVMKMDELHRRICVNSLAIAGGATALLAVAYGFMEGDVLPKLSIWWTYTTFMLGWIIATFFVRQRYR